MKLSLRILLLVGVAALCYIAMTMHLERRSGGGAANRQRSASRGGTGASPVLRSSSQAGLVDAADTIIPAAGTIRIASTNLCVNGMPPHGERPVGTNCEQKSRGQRWLWNNAGQLIIQDISPAVCLTIQEPDTPISTPKDGGDAGSRISTADVRQVSLQRCSGTAMRRQQWSFHSHSDQTNGGYIVSAHPAAQDGTKLCLTAQLNTAPPLSYDDLNNNLLINMFARPCAALCSQMFAVQAFSEVASNDSLQMAETFQLPPNQVARRKSSVFVPISAASNINAYLRERLSIDLPPTTSSMALAAEPRARILTAAEQKAGGADSLSIGAGKSGKVLCWIMTHPSHLVPRGSAIMQTWGKQCDKIVFITTNADIHPPKDPLEALDKYYAENPGMTPPPESEQSAVGCKDDSKGDPKEAAEKRLIKAYHKLALLDRGVVETTVHGLPVVYIPLERAESRETLWHKSKLAWRHVAGYTDDYDWFVRTDDDSYLSVPNLRRLLAKYDPDTPVTFGRKYSGSLKFYSGGGATVVSKAGMLKVLEAYTTRKELFIEHDTFADDMEISYVFGQLGMPVTRYKDEDDRDLFLALGMEEERGVTRARDGGHWIFVYNQDFKEGVRCCSSHWISNHYTSISSMYYVDAMVESMCEAGGQDPWWSIPSTGSSGGLVDQ